MDKQEKELEEILRIFDKAPSPSSENSVQNQAQQNNKQSQQDPKKPTDTERTARTSNQTEYKRQPPSSKGKYLSPKRKAAIKRRKRQRAVVVSFLALFFVALIIVLICKGCAGVKKTSLFYRALGITTNIQSMSLTAKATDVCVLIKPITMNLHMT